MQTKLILLISSLLVNDVLSRSLENDNGEVSTHGNDLFEPNGFDLMEAMQHERIANKDGVHVIRFERAVADEKSTKDSETDPDIVFEANDDDFVLMSDNSDTNSKTCKSGLGQCVPYYLCKDLHDSGDKDPVEWNFQDEDECGSFFEFCCDKELISDNWEEEVPDSMKPDSKEISLS